MTTFKNFFSENKKNESDNKLFQGIVQTVNLKIGAIRFQKLYDHSKTWIRYLIACICGLVFAIFQLLLCKNIGLYNSGLGGVSQGISRLVFAIIAKNETVEIANNVYNTLFWVLYFSLNVPLLIFSYLKIGKTFTKITITFLAINTLAGVGLSYIHGINSVYIFGNTIPHVSTGPINSFNTYKVANLPFWNQGVGDGEEIKVDICCLFLLLYGLVYGLINGLIYSLLYVIGGCSAGSDFIGIYYSSYKQKPLTIMLFITNGMGLLIGSLMGSYLAGGFVAGSQGAWGINFFLSSNLISSILTVVIMSFLINRWYPINKRIKLEVYGQNNEMIKNKLFELKYQHAISFIEIEGGYSKQKNKMLTTICSYIELPKLINKIKNIDPNVFIIVTNIQGVEGKMAVYRQGTQ